MGGAKIFLFSVAGQAHIAGSSEERALQQKAILTELKSANDHKEKLEKELFVAQQEKDRMEEQVKKLENEAVKLRVDNEELQQLLEDEKGLATLEDEKTQVEKLELQKAKDKTTTLSLQIDSILNPQFDAGNSEANVEVKQEKLETASKWAEGAATSVQRGVNGENSNLQEVRSRKRKASETRENLLISCQKEHKMSLTIIENGLSQLIEDEDTPVTMLGSLKALKLFTTSSTEGKDIQHPRKRKKLVNIQREVKQEEYFEHNDVKSEPLDQVESADKQNHDIQKCPKLNHNMV